MKYYHESRAWDKARARMRAPILVGWFLHGGSPGPARQPGHAGLTCPRCGGPVLKGWSCLGRACSQCARPW
jgi:hypothetical protein